MGTLNSGELTSVSYKESKTILTSAVQKQRSHATALTDDGIEELTDMVRAARITTKTLHEFLDDFVDDTDLAERIKAKSPR